MKPMGLTRQLFLCGFILFMACMFAVPAFPSDTAEQRKERLLQRVNTYWNDRVHGKIGQNYDLYDPFFKMRVKRIIYEANLIDIKFISYKIGDAKLTENIAKVPVEVEFEIPETVIAGKRISIPPRKDKWEEDWIGIDGDWFKVYKVNVNSTYIPFFPSFPP